MKSVWVEIPSELAEAAGLDPANLSTEVSALTALELYRQDKVSMGHAAELCGMPLEQFMEFAGRHNASLHYGNSGLVEDRRTLERLGL